MEEISAKSVILIGAGPMAIEYTKVLRSLKIIPLVIGRGEKNAINFQKETDLPVETGGIEKWLANHSKIPDYAIIAVTENKLGEVARLLIHKGVKHILLEKPGGADFQDIESVSRLAREYHTQILLAYNRRFYSSTRHAREMIREDGGITSFTFEFTEWSHRIKDIEKAPGVKENWLLHNSSHVIDLAFFLGGYPKHMHSFVGGSINWHPSGAIFTGAGITYQNTFFAYHANWTAPGRWWVEVNTPKNRLIFKPLEKLSLTKLGSVSIEEVQIDDELDRRFKPGLYREVDAFLKNDISDFIDIHQQTDNLKYYKSILTGTH